MVTRNVGEQPRSHSTTAYLLALPLPPHKTSKMQKVVLFAVCVALLATVAYAGPLDKLTEGVKDATSKVTGAVNSTVSGTKSAVNTVTNGTKGAIDSVSNATKAVGDIVKPKSAAGMVSAKTVVAAAGFGSLLLLGLAL